MNQLAINITKTRKLKGSTINIYLSNIKKIYTELFKTNFESVDKLYNYNKVVKYLDTLKDTTSKNVLNSIIVALKSYPKTPEEILKKYNKLLEEKTKQFFKDYNAHEMNEKDSENWITKKEVDEIKHKLKKQADKVNIKEPNRQNIDTFQQYLILELYTILPPLRNNFSDTIIESDPEVALKSPKNAIDLKNKRFILKVYKTNTVYGTKFINLPKLIIKLVKKWQKLNNTGYLLINTTNKSPMTSNGITKYLNKIFKPKKVSTTLLRKLYLSDKYSVQEMEDDAYIMGHSVKTQQLVYRKK
jgi:hypothetical protein